MPTYLYTCTEGHTSELRKGYEDGVVACPECGSLAVRLPIYQEQVVFTETGYNQRAQVPRDEVPLKKGFNLFREAAEEVDYKYSKVERETNQPVNPPLWKESVKRARQLAKAGVTVDTFRKLKTA